MANEIRVTFNAQLQTGVLDDRLNPSSLQVDQLASGAYRSLISVGTAEEVVGVGEITSPGWAFIQNTDATNFVTYGPDSTGMIAVGKLLPGEFAFLRLEPAVTLKIKADTAACDVVISIWEA